MIAGMAAILATVGALFAYMGGATQVNASLFKNNAAIKKTEASNQCKQNLAELALALVAEKLEAEALARTRSPRRNCASSLGIGDNGAADLDRARRDRAC